jgi:hypothetical protein
MRPAQKIWLPGRGVVDLEARRVSAAVEAYDPRLFFGRIDDPNHPGYGDWVIFVKMPHGEPPVPVLGFQREIPTPEEAVQRAHAANTKVHGDQLIDMVERDHAIQKERQEKAEAELIAEYVELMESGLRRAGATPQTRVFLNGRKDPNGR